MTTGLRLRRATLVALVALFGGACTRSTSDVQAFAAATISEVPPTPSTVPVTLYFRNAAGDASQLVAVEREIPRSEDPARRALELLIAGPDGSEGLPVLPDSVRVRRFMVEDEVAEVVLDGDLDGGHGPPDDRQRGGLLTLAAVANTLTEFPSISAVRLRTVTDQSSTAFGGWGTPPTLVRDESFIGPDLDGDPVAELAGFSTAPKVARLQHGDKAVSADEGRPRVASVRVVDRLAFVRIVIELASADAAASSPDLPRAEASAIGNLLRLKVADVEVPGDLPALIEGPGGAVSELALRPDGRDLVLNIRTANLRTHPFALLTDVNPARIVLDVKK